MKALPSVVLALATALCATGSTDADDSDAITGEVSISLPRLDLSMSPDAVPRGRPARASAKLVGTGAKSNVAITLHVPDGTQVRPSVTAERDGARGDVRVRWSVCRDAPGRALFVATAAYTDARGQRRILISPAQLLEVTPDGRGCPGRR